MIRPPSSRDVARSATTRPILTNYGRFESPERLAGDARLSPSVRIRLLDEWAQDLNARLQASDENMTAGESGQVGDLLRRVHVCLEKLQPPRPRH